MTGIPPPPRNLIIPLEICSLILNPLTGDTEMSFLEMPNQVYGKAIHGNTKITFKNGNSYEGDFENGMLNGIGVFTWSNGVKYTGKFFYNKLMGTGKFEWPDGSFYDGEVNLGLREGKGIFTAPNNESTYDGMWMKGMRQGFGRLTFKSGGYYEGIFHNGNKHGKGRMVYASGNYYDGEWQFDKKKGEGIMYWLNTKEKYYGSWDDNRQNGIGVHIWLEPKGEGKYLRNRYDGEWDAGQRHGQGTFYYANGAKYEGSWNRNQKDGYALFTDDTGKETFAIFKDDKILNEFDIILKKAIVENEHNEGNFETNLEIMKEMVENEKQEQGLSEKKNNENKEKASSSANIKSKANSPSMRKTKNRLVSGNKIEVSSNNIEINPENKKKEADPNPFYVLINIDDLLIGGFNQNKDLFMKNLTNMLLRHNPTLKRIYKYYSNAKNLKEGEDSAENENILGLNLYKVWNFIKEIKIMSPRVTLSLINRLLYQGLKNRYELKVPIEELKMKLNLLKEASDNNLFLTLDTNELFIGDFANKCKQNEPIDNNNFNSTRENYSFSKKHIMKNINIHDGNRVILYRNFVEIIVRIAYLKYGELNELHRSVEKLIIQKCEPVIEMKKKKIKDSSFHSSEHLGKYLNISVLYKDSIYNDVFKFKINKRQNLLYGVQDETILLKNYIELLNNARMIEDESDKNILFHFFERYYDQEESYSHYEHQFQLAMQMTQSTLVLNEKKEKEKKSQKDKEKEREYTMNKNKKISLLVEAELIFEEFYDSLTYFFLKKKDHRIKTEYEIEQYLKHKFETFISMNKRIFSHPVQLEARKWPYTEKDKLFEVVKVVRQERMKEELKKNDELRIMKQEEFERNLMAKEDEDVKLEEVDEEEANIEESEDSLY